jgi:hypothetical protein
MHVPIHFLCHYGLKLISVHVLKDKMTEKQKRVQRIMLKQHIEIT